MILHDISSTDVPYDGFSQWKYLEMNFKTKTRFIRTKNQLIKLVLIEFASLNSVFDLNTWYATSFMF